MKIIAVEGLDKSGKASLVRRLKEKLEADGYKVAVSEFHRYDTPTGKLIRQWLYGEYKVSQPTIELIMAADKYAQKEYFDELSAQGYDILLLDRYLGSQLVYSQAAGVPQEWVENLLKYLDVPDLEIFINVSSETSMKRKGKHGDNDRYESDKELLDRARSGFFGQRFYHRSGTGIFVVSGEGTSEETVDQAYPIVKKYLEA
jgi:dTMP kinase